MSAFSELPLVHDFTDALPGEDRNEKRPRQVFDACWSPTEPTPTDAPELLIVVPEVAEALGLDPEPTAALAEILTGNRVIDGMRPYAACYGGHQFGHWAGQLGDGRAITLCEIDADPTEVPRSGLTEDVPSSARRWEIQLKGAGRTPYSRGADGRAVHRSSLRELICSEAMFHLGVPTTRALSLAWTGDDVIRDMLYDGNPAPEPGAITCRVAPSFLRFGSYEIHAARGDTDTLRTLLEYTLSRFYPRYAEDFDLVGFFREVTDRTARLMCEWMRVGFVHGVMNTDNMSILGLTIDYGPYGWLEPFDPNWTPNTTDAQHRRYRYGHQPIVAQWNLSRLASALAVLMDDTDPLVEILEGYGALYDGLYRRMMTAKLGVKPGSMEQDEPLLKGLLETLTLVETDMTLFFRRLADVAVDSSRDERLEVLAEAYYSEPAFCHATGIHDWLDLYLDRVRAQSIDDEARKTRMNAVNPLYVPRNYLAQLAIDATTPDHTEPLHELLDVLRTPYTEQPGRERYAEKRPEWARHKPGCSMLSCSS